MKFDTKLLHGQAVKPYAEVRQRAHPEWRQSH
jgi:hypothetical protein